MEDAEFINKRKDSAKRNKFIREVVGKVLRDFKFNTDEYINKGSIINIKNYPNLKDQEMSIGFSNDKFSFLWKISCETDPIIVTVENNGSLIKKYDLVNSIEQAMNIDEDAIRNIIIKDIADAFNQL